MVGYYGYNCNRSCDGCLSDTCDSEHGICTDLSGCKPGWQPRQRKCDLGIFIYFIICVMFRKQVNGTIFVMTEPEKLVIKLSVVTMIFGNVSSVFRCASCSRLCLDNPV